MTFNIEAKIGDELEVFIVPSRRGGLQTEERINRRRAFLDRGSKARVGDRYVVKITGENPAGTVYFVTPLEMVSAGDGKSTILQKVSATIRSGRGHALPDEKRNLAGLTIARQAFADDPGALLDFISRLLESVQIDEGYDHINYGIWAEAAKNIIEEHFSGDPKQAAEALLRLVRLLPFHFGKSSIFHDLLSTAQRKCIGEVAAQSPALLESILFLREVAYEGFKYYVPVDEEYESVMMEQISQTERAGFLDVRRRLVLAEKWRDEKSFCRIGPMVYPLVRASAHLDQGSLQRLVGVLRAACHGYGAAA